MVAGINAFLDYSVLHSSTKQVMSLLSAKRDSIALSVEKLQETANNLKSENGKMSRKLALASLSPVAVNGCAYAINENMSYDDLRECANNLIANGTRKCILLSCVDDGSYIYVVSSAENDVRELVSVLNKSFNGKGGGKDNYAQGKLTAENKDELISAITELLQK